MSINIESHCSPERHKVFKRTGTCLTKKELSQIQALLKEKEEIKKYLKSKCSGKNNKDYCWVQSPVLKENYLEHFRPIKPKGWYKDKFQWLSNYDIMHVMDQYEKQYKCFKFMGVVCIDFESYCTKRELCNLSIKTLLENGKKTFAIICNLDKHNQPGSHWVAIFCSLNIKSKKFGISYYDSGGTKPPKEVVEFFKKVYAQVQDVYVYPNKLFKVKYNNTRHQFKNSECGVYSMLYVLSCLQKPKESYHKTRMSMGDDNEVHAFRDKLYIPNINVS